MDDLITAIGLVFFIEGLILAIIPSRIKNILRYIEVIPENKLRVSGIIFVIIGFIIIWLIRG